MALDSFYNLKSSIIRLDGSDSISDIVEDCISMTESQIYSNEIEPLRIRDMETRATTVTDGTRFLALPDGFLEMRRLQLVLSSGNADVRYASPEAMNVTASSGRPTMFTVTSQIEFDRVPGSTYTVEMAYHKKLDALSDSNTTNAILNDYPSIYLYGALWHVNLYNAEENKASYYFQLFVNAIKGANKRAKKGRYGPAPRMRTEGSTP